MQTQGGVQDEPARPLLLTQQIHKDLKTLKTQQTMWNWIFAIVILLAILKKG